MTPVVLALTEAGAGLARRVLRALGAGELHGLAGRVATADRSFADTGAHLREQFREGHPIVGVCASGILIRALAPLIGDKRTEPPVVAVSEDGRSVVPLLGGHRGANDLAERIAAILKAHAAITTAGDLAFGLALDAPPAGWTLANPEQAKAVMAAVLAGETARVDPALAWAKASGRPESDCGAVRLRASVAREADDASLTLVYRPQSLAVGVGCERGADPRELSDLVRRGLDEAGLSRSAVGCVVSLDLKTDEPAVHALARELGVPARFFDPARLELETPRLASPSEAVYREVGCHGVAEAAALAAAGPRGRLRLAKRKGRRTTCAIAEAEEPLVADRIGRARGRLSIVGLGPGGAPWRTREAEEAIAAATDLVGYSLYLDLLGAGPAEQRRHAFALGEEEARCRAALDLAAEGREVVLVSSGDPGIYAMASPVFELLEREGRGDWSRVEIRVVPGLSALQAAAARIGAPLGHDFCAISLSDLLTPWESIRARIEAAGQGDFVVAFYNPVSRRRTWQLAEAVTILREHRPGEVPVVIARNLGRDGESLEVVRFSELDAQRVDMLSVVLVGSSATRAVPRGDGGTWVYTPRGYGEGRSSRDSGEDVA